MSNLIAIVRERRPLVHAVTNLVTMDWVARGLLAAGAAPVMARAVEEAGLVQSDALVLNLGTWDPEVQRAMLAAGEAANRRGVPVVLDPVGAGGIPTRLTAARELLAKVRVTAIRGNAGEISALAACASGGGVRGVDAVKADPLAARGAAEALARQYGCIVAVTGPVDVVTDGSRALEVKSGHPLMARLPGTGCLGSALIAGALAVDASLDAVAAALLWLGVAGEAAAAVAAGPGTFAVALLDGLASVTALPAGRIDRPLADRMELYVIVSGATPLPVVRAALEGGAGTIQWREKQLDLPAQVEAARQVQALCREFGALFLVNDRVDLALALDADGVHVGQEDLPVPLARKLLGPDKLIGTSVETAAEAARAEAEGCDYLGSGPVYATPSKADAGEPYGPALLGRVTPATRLPVVGIGGIGPGGAAPVVRAGAAGVAVISSVTQAADPLAAARALLAEVRTAKGGIHP
jgi:hydroxyethylthiazole kinase/thiamine-phosphate diphosphorylase